MDKNGKTISIMVPTYNEEENVIPLADAIRAEFHRSLPAYEYEILFIDNDSQDSTREKIEALCRQDPHIRAIFNARNFGQFNSPYWGICQTSGDCTIPLCADFQDPIEVIPQLVAKWEEGYKVICAVKNQSRENRLIRFLRTCYYKMIHRMSDVEQIEHFTGFGLYDRSFVDVLRSLDDPTPFIRGIVAELGFRRTTLNYTQAQRRAGHTHNNVKTLYDAAMQSFTTYTKSWIRWMVLSGVFLCFASVLGGIACVVLAILHVPLRMLWMIPLVAFFASVQLTVTGILGEYIWTVKTKVIHRPLVIEEKRINFQ